MKNYLNFQNKPKLHNSNSIIKNKLRLNDPAFRSNNTLKEYINHKLDTIYNDNIKNNKSQEFLKNRSSISNNQKQSFSKKYNSNIKSKSLANKKIKHNEQYVIFNYTKKFSNKTKYNKETSSTYFNTSTDNNNKLLHSTSNNYSGHLSKKSITTNSQINLLKNEINELLNNKNIKKTKNKQTCDSNFTKKNKIRKSINQVKLLESKIQKLLKNDENENKENECPMPMPYVKRYSNEYNNIINCKFDETEIFKKDLKEPKPEKNVPLPLSMTNNRYDVQNIKIKKLTSKRNNRSKYVNDKNKIRK